MLLRKAFMFLIVLVILSLGLTACNSKDEKKETSFHKIDFSENELYAVAYLGYTEYSSVQSYVKQYLTDDFDTENIRVNVISEAEYYLIIPRYENMSVKLYKNDFDTDAKTLIFESKNAKPFIVACNISDIIPDATVSFTYNGETVSFSPFVSMQSGEFVIGDRGKMLPMISAED